MTPLTKEQAEALADRIERRIINYTAGTVAPSWQFMQALKQLATEIRDGTFIEVQHD